ncbi:MAG: C4-type zinc ribbon domain-containing protein [Candidatus Omnitrophota bacterium]|nr:C4-type zinc ribbon domain-containing protein [Candidatus Omnitrophota bacterium]
MANLEDQLKLLIELQGLDTQILKIERDLESIPEDIKRMDGAFEEKKANLKKLEDGAKALALKRKEKEMDLESKEGAIKKFQSQLYQVKTNKEYTALEGEIGRAKADNSLVEEEILKIFDQMDAENQKISKEKDFLKTEEGKLILEKKKLDDEVKRIKGEVDGLRTRRADLAQRIDKAVLVKYDRILKGKDGLAVVPVAGGSCQGCFRIMPPQVIHEINMKKDLVFCENCARILYIEE